MPDLTKPPTPEQLEAWPPLTKADIELIEDMSGDQLSAVFRGDGERARVLAQVHAKEIAALWPRIVTTAMLLWQTQKLNPTPTKSVVPEGMVMVPREPTDKMLDDGFNALAETHRRGPYGECGGVGWNDAEECYRAMIQAAPNDGAEEE